MGVKTFLGKQTGGECFWIWVWVFYRCVECCFTAVERVGAPPIEQWADLPPFGRQRSLPGSAPTLPKILRMATLGVTGLIRILYLFSPLRSKPCWPRSQTTSPFLLRRTRPRGPKELISPLLHSPIAAGKLFCGLEAIVSTPDGKSATMFIGDAFDDRWVLTPTSIDVAYGAFWMLFGRETSNKNDVVQGVTWELTGNRRSE